MGRSGHREEAAGVCCCVPRMLSFSLPKRRAERQGRARELPPGDAEKVMMRVALELDRGCHNQLLHAR